MVEDDRNTITGDGFEDNFLGSCVVPPHENRPIRLYVRFFFAGRFFIIAYCDICSSLMKSLGKNEMHGLKFLYDERSNRVVGSYPNKDEYDIQQIMED